MVELLSEPFYILAQLRLRLQLRVFAEASATLARGVATLVLLKLSLLDVGVSLSLAQVCLRVSCPCLGCLAGRSLLCSAIHGSGARQRLAHHVDIDPVWASIRTAAWGATARQCDACHAVYLCSSHLDGLYRRHGGEFAPDAGKASSSSDSSSHRHRAGVLHCDGAEATASSSTHAAKFGLLWQIPGKFPAGS